MFFDAERTFEKARELGENADFATPIRQFDEANEVEYERRCEQ